MNEKLNLNKEYMQSARNNLLIVIENAEDLIIDMCLIKFPECERILSNIDEKNDIINSIKEDLKNSFPKNDDCNLRIEANLFFIESVLSIYGLKQSEVINIIVYIGNLYYRLLEDTDLNATDYGSVEYSSRKNTINL